ncbi:MAG: GldG family protein [Ruminococcus sp.]|nr:GldG family protein [Ruminococcus sp.]
MKKDSKYAKKIKYGTMAAIITAFVVAIVIVVNIIMGILTERYPMKLDLTKDKRYELCDESINVLKNLEKDVEIAVMFPEETLLQYEYYNMIPKILEKYEVYSKQGKGNVEVKYYDIQKNPDAVARYKKYFSGDITQGSVVVCCDDKVKVSNLTSYYTTDQSSYYYDASANYIFIGESTLTSAIMSVADANTKKAAFLDRMGENMVFSQNSYYSISQLYALMGSNGYECTELDISENFLEDNYDVVVIPAPETDFTTDIIDRLDDYLYNDGKYMKNIVYISSPTATDLPNIEAFLDKWSIEIGDSFVSDDENCVAATLTASGSAVMSPKGVVADTENFGDLPNASLPIAVPYSRPVNIIKRNNDVLTSYVLESSKDAYQVPLANLSEPSDEKAVTGFIALSQRQQAEQFDVYSSNLLTIGSVFMLDPAVMGNTNAYNNANFILNALNYVSGKDKSAVIPQKNLEQQVITIDQKQADTVRNIVVYLIPAIVVICGIVVFVRRKNK